MFATSKLCPLGPAEVCIILKDGAREAQVEQANIVWWNWKNIPAQSSQHYGAVLCILESGKSIAFLQ